MSDNSKVNVNNEHFCLTPASFCAND